MIENSGRHIKPTIGRANRDRIGRALRAMYEELLHQPLPENLTTPLRALDEVESSRRRLEQALANMRGTDEARNDHRSADAA
jgi:hypothetical protein